MGLSPSHTTFLWKPVESSSGPAGRFDHSFTKISGSKYLMFGGVTAGWQYQNDLWEYDESAKTWTELHTDEVSRPTKRKDHTAIVANNRLYIFGGTNDRKDSFNDVWAYDYKDKKWLNIISPEPRPSVRHGHSAILHKNRMIIFGGAVEQQLFGAPQERQEALNDLWAFDFSTEKWCSVEQAGDAPSRRLYHTATIVGNEMVVVGGYSNGSPLDDYFSFCLDKKEEKEKKDKDSKEKHQEKGCWKNLGKLPFVARSGHTAVAIDSANVLILAGEGRISNSVTCLNDCWVYNHNNFTWLEILTESTPEDKKNQAQRMMGSRPGERLGARAELGKDSKSLILFGGIRVDGMWNPVTWYNDIWMLCPDKLKSAKQALQTAFPQPAVVHERLVNVPAAVLPGEIVYPAQEAQPSKVLPAAVVVPSHQSYPDNVTHPSHVVQASIVVPAQPAKPAQVVPASIVLPNEDRLPGGGNIIIPAQAVQEAQQLQREQVEGLTEEEHMRRRQDEQYHRQQDHLQHQQQRDQLKSSDSASPDILSKETTIRSSKLVKETEPIVKPASGPSNYTY